MRGSQLERVLVTLIALHSFCVGVILCGFPHWAAEFGGWGDLDSLFFVRQGGAFHLVVAAGYLMEYWKLRTVRLLLVAKSVGTVFLILSWLFDQSGPWAVPFAALGDGLMGLSVWWISRRVDRTS